MKEALQLLADRWPLVRHVVNKLPPVVLLCRLRVGASGKLPFGSLLESVGARLDPRLAIGLTTTRMLWPGIRGAVLGAFVLAWFPVLVFAIHGGAVGVFMVRPVVAFTV